MPEHKMHTMMRACTEYHARAYRMEELELCLSLIRMRSPEDARIILENRLKTMNEEQQKIEQMVV